MLRLLLPILLISTAVYADWTGNWTSYSRNQFLPVQTLVCTPDSFSITQNSSGGYTISYNFTTNLNSGLCSVRNISQQYVSSPLTYNSNSGLWLDSFNESLYFNMANETIFWTLCYTSNNACNISALYLRDGDDPNQAFYFDSSYGTWLNPSPVSGSDPTTCNPPTNVTVDMLTGYLFNSATMTFNNGTTVTETAKPLTGPTLNVYWNIPTLNINLTYSYDNAQTILQLEYLSTTGATCIFSYQKLNDLISGTWYNDWQNNDNTLPPSIIVSIVNNTFMNLTYSNGGSYTLFEYAQDPTVSWNDYITAYYGQKYEYDYAADVLYSNNQYIYTKNGSILSAAPFVGNWSNPTFQDNSDEEKGCCLPTQISISNPATNTLTTTFYFTEDALSSSWCTDNDIETQTDGSLHYTTLSMSISSPNPTGLLWYDSSYGYYLAFTNTSTTSQIRLQLVGVDQSCMFFMTPGNNIPNSSDWIGNSIFSLILSVVVFGLL